MCEISLAFAACKVDVDCGSPLLSTFKGGRAWSQVSEARHKGEASFRAVRETVPRISRVEINNIDIDIDI